MAYQTKMPIKLMTWMKKTLSTKYSMKNKKSKKLKNFRESMFSKTFKKLISKCEMTYNSIMINLKLITKKYIKRYDKIK